MIRSKCQYKYAVRRLKRANESIQNDKFVSGIMSGGVNIFNEIKKFRGVTKNCSSRIDEQVGAKNIANHLPAFIQNSIADMIMVLSLMGWLLRLIAK